MNKYWFLFTCFCRIAYRMGHGKEWNRLNAELEELDGSRKIIWYGRTATGYALDGHIIKPGGKVVRLDGSPIYEGVYNDK
jgi:hypothetical protein